MGLIADRLALPSIKKDNRFELLQNKIIDLFKKSPVIFIGAIILLVGIMLVIGAGKYFSSQANKVPASSAKPTTLHKIVGFNQTVDRSESDARIQTIINQPATLTISGQTHAISPSVIRSWLIVKHDGKKPVDYIFLSSAAMTKSLNSLVNKYVKSPVNQVVVTRADGSSKIIVNGRNGTQLVNPSAINDQVKQSAKTVMDAKGLNFSAEIVPLEFQSISPASFDKMIEVDVTTKQMYLYQKGNLYKSYPISAGEPNTPTPIGQFKTYAKFSVQDMRGDNVDGSRYFQPHVRWIQYFLAGGYAIHGNYWRPASVFGRVNTSHGCVSLPEHQAKEVFDWAPIGTTVITHY